MFSPEYCSDSGKIIFIFAPAKKNSETSCPVKIQSLQIVGDHITQFVSKIHYWGTENWLLPNLYKTEIVPKFYRMMSYFLPYGNKQTVEKAVVQNLCIDEHEQPGEVLVQDSIKAGLPAPGNTECSSSPPSHGCSNSDVCICYPNAHSYQWIFLLCISRGLVLFSVIFFPFPQFRFC